MAILYARMSKRSRNSITAAFLALAVGCGGNSALPDASRIDAAVVHADAASIDASDLDAHAPPDAHVDAVTRDATPDTKIIVFSTMNMQNGSLGGRNGADGLCLASRGQLSCPNAVHAFLSVSALDEIERMPLNYGVPTNVPVQSANGSVTLATDWADLLDGSIDNAIDDSIIAAENLSSGWWSGSNDDGSVSSSGGFATNCAGWTSGSSGAEVQGSRGAAGVTDSTWINQDNGDHCSANANVLCLCY